jgi:hypothetical protein
MSMHKFLAEMKQRWLSKNRKDVCQQNCKLNQSQLQKIISIFPLTEGRGMNENQNVFCIVVSETKVKNNFASFANLDWNFKSMLTEGNSKSDWKLNISFFLLWTKDLNLSCQSFRNTIYQKGGNYTRLALNFQIAVMHFKWPLYIHFPFQDPQKFTQIVIFGLKLYHLATLLLI